MFTISDVERCNAEMIRLLGLGPGLFTKICIAPEAPDQPAIYRKPSPRFAHELCESLRIESQELCYVGDRGSDIQTAVNAGAWAIAIRTGLNDVDSEIAELNLADCGKRIPVVDSFSECVTKILSNRDE